MQIIRTAIWVVATITFLIFAINNWNPVEIKIWEGLIWETKLPALILAAFLLGLLPMWLLHHAGRWRLTRKITALENSVRPPAMLATSTQLNPEENS